MYCKHWILKWTFLFFFFFFFFFLFFFWLYLDEIAPHFIHFYNWNKLFPCLLCQSCFRKGYMQPATLRLINWYSGFPLDSFYHAINQNNGQSHSPSIFLLLNACLVNFTDTLSAEHPIHQKCVLFCLFVAVVVVVVCVFFFDVLWMMFSSFGC